MCKVTAVITGKIISKQNAHIFLDTTGNGKADKSIFCDRDTFIHVTRFCDRRFSYYDAYAVMSPGDTVSFPVKLPQGIANSSYFIKTDDLDGEPFINGNNAFTLRLYRQMQEMRALISKDKTFSIGK